MMQRAINLETLSEYFHLPITEVARKIGVCATVLKKICRKNGIPRWPHRKIKSLDKMISTLESIHTKSPAQSERIQKEITILRSNKEYLMKNPGVVAQNSNLKKKRCSDSLQGVSSIQGLREPTSPVNIRLCERGRTPASAAGFKLRSSRDVTSSLMSQTTGTEGIDPVYLNLSSAPLASNSGACCVFRVPRISDLKKTRARSHDGIFCEQQHQRVKRLRVADKSQMDWSVAARSPRRASSYPFKQFTLLFPYDNELLSSELVLPKAAAAQQFLVEFPVHMDCLLPPGKYASDCSVDPIFPTQCEPHTLPTVCEDASSSQDNAFLLFPLLDRNPTTQRPSSPAAADSSAAFTVSVSDQLSYSASDENSVSLMQLAMAVESDLETISSDSCSSSGERFPNKDAYSSSSDGFVPKVAVIPGVDTVLIGDSLQPLSCAFSRPCHTLPIGKGRSQSSMLVM